MPDGFLFLLAALATYRLSRLIADEEGPWSMFSKLRDLTPEMSSWRRGIECILCVSVWVSFPIAILLLLLGACAPWVTPLVWLALSAVTVLIRKWENKRYDPAIAPLVRSLLSAMTALIHKWGNKQ